MKPADLFTEAQINAYSLPFQKSSRIRALEENTSKSIGASCNYFAVEDNLESIGKGMSWGTSVLGYQGAPSWDLSNLRPAGTPLGSKGTASGAVSFGRIYDRIVGELRREEKKNGAGVLGLDYRHPELHQFLQEPYSHAYKLVYLPMHDTLEAKGFLQDEEKLNYLAEAYNSFKCFLVKRPLPLSDGTQLGINLCTEVEIPHKGFCILGSLNLSYFTKANIHLLPSFFRLAMQKLTVVEEEARKASEATEFLSCPSLANRQVGLGIYGLASVLGAWGISYEQFNETLEDNGISEVFDVPIDKLAKTALKFIDHDNVADVFVSHLIKGYAEASDVARAAGLRAAFCIQPTVSTSQRSLDAFGYNVSPEIQPVDAIKHEGGVSFIRKSAIKGDSVQICHPSTWTMDEVSYETYAHTSSLLQQLMDSTGLGHRHSHCFYGERFTAEDLRKFYTGKTRHRKSLYYRLPFSNNTESLKKDKLWQTVDDGELFSGDIEALVNKQRKGNITCECED